MRQFINIAKSLLLESPETDERLQRAAALGYDTSRVWYHGSNAEFDAFSHDFVGMGHDQNGSGFYFTTSREDAEMYSGITTQEDGWRKGSTPNVKQVFLRLRNAVPKEKSLPRNAIKKIVEQGDDDDLWNFGDISHLGRDAVVRIAVDAYAAWPGIAAMNALNNDLYGSNEGHFLRVFEQATGMNHVMAEANNGVFHCVMFLPNDIRSIHADFRDDKSPNLMA